MFHQAHRAMARIHFSAGARRVVSLHVDAVECTSLEEIEQFDRSEYGSLKHAVFSAHQMGGCLMGEDPKQSVVDSTLLFHGLDNLFVVDGSVFPTGLGVNPSETIYGLAHRAAEIVAGRI
jgi:choline dehydrogenase-like flavoprotein